MKMFTAQSRPPIHQLKERNDGTFVALDTIRFWTFKELVNADPALVSTLCAD
jgi:hypothetical protein